MSEEDSTPPRGRYSSAHDLDLRELIEGMREDLATKLESLRPPAQGESTNALLRKLIIKLDDHAAGTRFDLRKIADRLERDGSREFGESPSGHHYVKTASQEMEDQKLLREMASQIHRMKKVYGWGKAILPLVAAAGGAIHWLLSLHH
jgi:hypothetical protein